MNVSLKYIFDRFAALVGLIVLSPIIIGVAILILRKMPGGPVLFKQKRVGQYGKIFTMYKFRTMAPEHDGCPVSIEGESRVLPLGAKLRKYKLDELPQLWNVLVGNMSFVGPRPDVPGYADQLQGDDRRILKLKPGITGPASLKYRDEESELAQIDFQLKQGKEVKVDGLTINSVMEYNDLVIYPDKVRINLYYLDHYSFVKDLHMIYCSVFGGTMVYGGEVI